MATDGTVKIGTKLDESGITTGLKSTEKVARKTFEEIAKESGKTVEELKADIKRIAEEYQRQGYNIPNSYKKAYADMGVYSKSAKKSMVEDADDVADSHESSSKRSKNAWKSALSDIGTYAQKGFAVLEQVAVTAAKATATAVAGLTAAMSAATVAGVKYNATIEGYQTSFEVMTGSAEKAAEVVERLKELGASTPFELPDLANATQLLMNYGFTADEAIDRMLMLGDISQGSADKMGRIAMAYGQMSSAGKVALEDVKQMIEAGFNPLQEISDTTGESMASLYERISKGTISVDEITASMQRATSEGGKYYQSMEKQAQTMDGLMSTLKDNAQALLGDVVRPVSEAITGTLLPSAISAIDALSTAYQENGLIGMAEAGRGMIQGLLSGVVEQIPSLIQQGFRLVSDFKASIMEQMPTILEKGAELVTKLAEGAASMLPHIVQRGIESVLAMAEAVLANLPTLLDAGVQLIYSLAQGVVNALPTLIDKVPEIITQFWDTFDSLLWKIVEAGFNLVKMLGKGIIDNIGVIVDNAWEIVIAIVSTIAHLDMINMGKTLITNLAGGVKTMLSAIAQAAKDVVHNLTHPFDIKDWSGIGKNLIDGIKKGIVSAAKSLAEAAKNAVGGAVSSIKEFLGINSPSKLARDLLGKNMIAGIGVGFEMESDDLDKKAVGTVKKAVGAMQNSLDASSAVAAMKSSAYRTSDAILGGNTMGNKNTTEPEKHEPQGDNDLPGRIGRAVGDALEGKVFKVGEREFARLVEEVV